MTSIVVSDKARFHEPCPIIPTEYSEGKPAAGCTVPLSLTTAHHWHSAFLALARFRVYLALVW